MKFAIKELKIKRTFIIITSVYLALFFIFYRPFVPFDGDDWLNLSTFRSSLFPVWGAFNPSKVLPETLQPLVGVLSSLILPITKSIINSIVIVSALLLVGVFALLINELWNFLSIKFNLGPASIALVLTLYTISQFLIFKTGFNNNGFLLLPIDFTCLFHYVIPGLLCQFLTIFFLNNGSLEQIYKDDLKKFSVVSILLYFAVFSNIIINIMIPLIMFYIIFKQHNFSLKTSILEIFVILVWIISLVFESSGGRSKNFSGESIYANLRETINSLHTVHFNHYFLLYVFFVVGLFVVISVISKTIFQWELILLLILASVLSLIYQIIICAKSSPNYISRPDVLMVPFFYLLLILIILTTILLSKSKYRWIKPIVSLLVCLLLIQTFNTNQILSSSVAAGGSSPEQAKKLDNSIISKIYQANNNGELDTTVYVPKRDGTNNWPNSINIGQNISNFLYQNDLINNRITVKTVPSDKLNSKYLITN